MTPQQCHDIPPVPGRVVARLAPTRDGALRCAAMPDHTSPLPSLDALLRSPEAAVLADRFGRPPPTSGLRAVLAARRAARSFDAPPSAILDEAADALAR